MGSPEMRPAICVEGPCRVTPNAKDNSNVINVGEVAVFEANIVKKMAQLERATAYAHFRTTEASDREAELLEVVGYETLGMSMMDRSSMGTAMSSLHPDWFPNLALLQQKGSLAYLSSDGGVFQDISMLIDGCSKLSADMTECLKITKQCNENIEELKEQMTKMLKQMQLERTGMDKQFYLHYKQMHLRFAEFQKQMQRCGHVLLFAGITVGAFLWFRSH